MKRRFSKILGVGLTLALLTSLLLTAAPVSALSVPSVTVSPTTISEADAEYSIRFELDEQLTGGSSVAAVGTASTPTAYDLAEIGDSFVITADTDTDTATITPGGPDTVTVTVSGATITTPGPPVVVTFTAAGQTATVTALTADTNGNCAGTWFWTGATAPTALVTVGDEVADTITVVFPSGTAVAEDPDPDPVVAILAGPGWINGLWLVSTITSVAEVGTADTRTVVLTVPVGEKIGEGAEVRLSFTAGITNPDDAGDYNLTVATSKEDAVTSADYEIEVPDIGLLPGIVQQFNAAVIPVLMATATGDAAINTLVDTAGEGYTIVVGPGEYKIAATIDLDQAGLILKSSGGADDTIIDASALTGVGIGDGSGILIDAADVTVDGFTVADANKTGIYINGVDAIVQNNVVTFDEYYGIGIDIGAVTGVKVSGNVINEWGTMFVNGSDATLSGNTFGECVNLAGTIDGLTITNNIMIGSAAEAIDFFSGGTFTDVLIEGNTISEAEGSIYTSTPTAIVIRGTITNLQILGNEITDNEGVGILVEATETATPTAIAIKFNTITGNDADNDGYGIQNDDDDAIVDASLNWWGTAVADDIVAMVNDTGDSVTTYEPFLADTYDAVFSASDVAVGATSIAKDTADVAVSVTLGDDAQVAVVNVISVAKYIANPEEALADAIAFFDVYVAGTFDDPDNDKATIKFYAGDTNTEVYIWSADTLTWGEVTPVSFSAYGGYVYVTIEDPAMLTGTPFALVAGTAEEIPAPEILSPVTGDDTVRLRPVFAWLAVASADGYYFQLADNADFVVPMVKMEGDTGRLSGTTYAYVGEELPYSTPYHWRVKAVSGTIGAGNLAESAWTGGVFITMDEPVEPVPPVVVEPTPPAPPAPIIEPIVEVIVPPATAAMTPTWIYAIIAVGGVLVIALIVLIVRTRRVA